MPLSVRKDAPRAMAPDVVCDMPRAIEELAQVGIGAIPTRYDDCRHPLIDGLEGGPKFGCDGALAIAEKFAQSEPYANVAIWCGARSGITVVDIDTPDIGELAWARKKFGKTNVLVGTPSGGFHLYFRHAGERRWVRPFPGHPVDILGSGVCVAPPSVKPGVGQYQFIEGDYSDLLSLRSIKPGALSSLRPGGRNAPKAANDNGKPSGSALADGLIVEGHRDRHLFDFALLAAHKAASSDELASILRAESEARCRPPLDEAGIQKIVGTVWRYKESGALAVPGQQLIPLRRTTADKFFNDGSADALMLHARLAAANWEKDKVFAVSANAMARARVLGDWSPARYRAARARLCELGVLVKVHHGGKGKGDPSKFRFAEGAIH